jgi:phosphopentomutase
MATMTIIVLDSVGVGALPDAAQFGDEGADTLDHTIEATGVQLPNLTRLGLGNISGVTALPASSGALASSGRLAELSPGKDTTTGHWEFMGVVLEHPFRTFEAFPPEVMDAFDAATGRGHLGNYPASGTQVIERLGQEHLATGKPIVYTSADSVFQIAAHTDIVPLETLYQWSEAARQILQGDNAVARVIARPFTGTPGAFERLGEHRRDYSVAPPELTVLDALKVAGRQVIGLGKIPDIYDHRGFTREVHTASNMDGVDRTLEVMRERPDGLVFVNLVEFDSLYGHRRDAAGYARALQDLDARIPELLDAVQDDDVLFFVSDHGNDPTWPGTDHTREYGLLLAYGRNLAAGDLGTRASFADVGATVAELLGVPWSGAGTSFVRQLRAAED